MDGEQMPEPHLRLVLDSLKSILLIADIHGLKRTDGAPMGLIVLQDCHFVFCMPHRLLVIVQDLPGF